MSSNQETIDRQDKRRIAVIAFHGVADQQPCATARAIAGMLLDLPPESDNGIYSDFKESELRIPVDAVDAAAKAGAQFAPETQPPAASWRSYFQFDPRPQLWKRRHQKDKGQSPAASQPGRSIVEDEGRPSREDLDHQFTQRQLEHYDPADADLRYHTTDSVYETIQLTGFRQSSANRGAGNGGQIPPEATTTSKCEVHLYEMYWADLSRVSSAVLRVLIDFYQLLAYLCVIGRTSLDFARAKLPYSKWWGWFMRAQLGAEWMVTLFIPVLNLFLIGLAAELLPFQLRPSAYEKTAIAAVTLVAAIIVGWLLHKKHSIKSGKHWPWRFLVVLAAGAAGAVGACWLASGSSPYFFYSTLAFGWWLLAAFLVCLMMKAYNRRTPGALVVSIGWALLISAVYFCELVSYRNASPGVGERILAASIQTAGWIAILLGFVWFLFVILALVTSFTGFGVACVACAGSSPDDKDGARRAIWTVNLTLVLPGALTLLANLATWKALSVGLYRMQKAGGFSDRSIVWGSVNWRASEPERLFNLHAHPTTLGVLDQLIDCFASGWFTIFFIAFGLAALLAVWSLLPAISSNNSPDQPDTASKWLGEALSAGYRAMRISGELLRVVVLGGGLLLLCALLIFKFSHEPPLWLQTFRSGLQRFDHPEVLSALGLILWLMLIASQGPFRRLALGFRAAIDIALDVANWLRLHPRDSNPKARISARFVSQLNYLADWRDPRDGGRYDAFVLIAHSQGSVIASEILRYLQVANHSVVAKLRDRKLYLFTMGCPLRQLYSLRFPHQYAWARHNATQWAGKDPDPKHLGIAEWVNAYRSGDYVGRYLWHPDASDDQWDDKTRPLAGTNTRREFCIGPGDHTHYWDKTAPKIAEELDRLIGEACSQAPAAPQG